MFSASTKGLQSVDSLQNLMRHFEYAVGCAEMVRRKKILWQRQSQTVDYKKKEEEWINCSHTQS